MDIAVPPELEELIICSHCHSPFNDTDSVPKLFSCRHYFCLRCVNSFMQQKCGELYCIHCWKRTELSGPDVTPDSLPTYGAILYLSQNLDVLSLKTNVPSTSAFGRGGTAGAGANCGIGAFGVRKQRSSSSTSSSIASNGNGNTNGNGGGASCNSGSSSNLTNCGLSGIVNGATSMEQEPSRVRSNSNTFVLSENCMTHAMPHTLWCENCNILVCRACAGSEEHRGHIVKSHTEAREQIQADICNELKSMQRTLSDVQHFVYKQRDFLLRILESCSALKTKIETELMSHLPTTEICEMRESLGRARVCLELLQNQTPTDALKLYSTLHVEKQRLQAKYQEMFLQCKLDELIRNYCNLFDFNVMQQVLAQLHSYILNGIPVDAFVGGGGQNGMASHHNPVLLLANYCIAQLYSRHLTRQNQQQQQQPPQQQPQQQQRHPDQQQQMFTNGAGVSGGGYHQQQKPHQQQLSAHLQLLSPPQSLSSQSSPRDGIPTYADITSSPQHLPHPSNQQTHHQQHLGLNGFNASNNGSHLSSLGGTASSSGAGSVCSGRSGGGGVSDGILAIAPLGAIGQPIRVPSTSTVVFPTPGDLNGIGLSLMHIQQQQQKLDQQQAQQKSQQKSQQQQQQTSQTNTLLCNPSVQVLPIYYFNIEINGQARGRILIEVRNDVAPKMAQNFAALTTHEFGFGYKGCHIFQCWENESIITGDFELNNGRGGRSVFDEGFFMPDDTKIVALRGSVGMRRSQKRHDNLGLVGSQFRIILREMRGFTGIFAHVVEGLELVERISQAGDSAGKPQTTVVIVSCGKYK